MAESKHGAELLIDWLKEASPYITTIFLSSWGGVVQYIQKINGDKKAKFSWKELLFDIIVSSFAGFLTYMLCKATNIEGPMSAILIAVSGHMGTRAIASFRALHARILPTKDDQK